MSIILPLQHRYNVVMKKEGKSSDITDFLGDNVTLEVDVMHMSHLTFEIKNPELNAEWLSIGNKVEFSGGYLQTPISSNRDRLADSSRFKRLFNGTIKEIQLKYADNGLATATVMAIDGSWTPYGEYNDYTFRYPSKKCSREIGRGTSVKLSELVKAIIEKPFPDGLGCNSKVDLGENQDTLYTLSFPVCQTRMSDWGFLKYLAERNNCYFWTSVEGSNTVVNFVSKSKAVTEQNRLEFVWIGRGGGDKRNFTDAYVDTFSASGQVRDAYLREAAYGLSDDSKLKENQIKLLTVDIKESPSMFGALVHQITDFNTETGEEETHFVMYDETKDELIYYELDKAKIETMQQTPDGAKTLKQIQDMGAFGIPWSVAKDYYIAKKTTKAINDAIDKPFLGITVTATCYGNVNIQPQQSYMVHGVSRFSSMRNKSRRYWLKTMKHEWSNSGFITSLEFWA